MPEGTGPNSFSVVDAGEVPPPKIDPFAYPHDYVIRIPVNRFTEIFDRATDGMVKNSKAMYRNAVLKFIRATDPDGAIYIYRAMGERRCGDKYRELVNDPVKLMAFVQRAYGTNMAAVESNARRVINEKDEKEKAAGMSGV